MEGHYGNVPGTIANTSNCAMAIDGLFFKIRLILLQIKQTCQHINGIYPSRYIKQNDTNAATRPTPQEAGIAARMCSSWVLLENLKFESDILPARRMLIPEWNFPVWKGNFPVIAEYSGSERNIPFSNGGRVGSAWKSMAYKLGLSSAYTYLIAKNNQHSRVFLFSHGSFTALFDIGSARRIARKGSNKSFAHFGGIVPKLRI